MNFPTSVLNGGLDQCISDQFNKFTSDYNNASTEKQSEMVMGVLGNVLLLWIPGSEITKFGKAGEMAEVASDVSKGGKVLNEADKAIETDGKLAEADRKAKAAAEAAEKAKEKSKAVEEARKAAEKAKALEESKKLTVSRKLQKTTIQSVENGKAKLETTLQKGNYGEMKWMITMRPMVMKE